MSGRLPEWLANWLGVPIHTSADAATWQLDSRWSWAPWATLVLVQTAIAWTVVLYAREAGSAGRPYRAMLAALRLATIALVLIMLAQWALALRLTGPAAIAVVIDHSASMGIADREENPSEAAQLGKRLSANGLGEPTRLNIAKLLLTEDNARRLSDLAARYRLATYLTAGDVERIADDSKPSDVARVVVAASSDGVASQSTRIGDALMRVASDFRSAPPAAVLLFSDGIVTEGISLADAAQNLRATGTPIMAVGLGSGKPPRDIEIADVLVDDIVFVDDLVSFQVQIKATGLEGESAKLTLRREGDSAPLMEEPVKLPAAGQIASVRLTHRPTAPGGAVYAVEIEPRGDETNKKNNRQTRKVSVRDEKIRVLLAQGYPNYEFRFLKTLLERDPSVQLATYLQDADAEYAEQDKTALKGFPVNRDEHFGYDVLIIGDIDPRVLPGSVWQSIRTFVAEKGGGAVFIAGPRFMPMSYRDNPDVAAMLPIKLDSAATGGERVAGAGFAVRPTTVGSQSPGLQLGDTVAETQQTWARLAPLYWRMPLSELKPGAEVLADGASKPVICFQYFGAGRVFFQAIDSTWRWRIGAGERFFARYWVQTVRFAARGKLGKGRGVQLSTDRREYRRGEVAQVKARFLDTQLAPHGDEVVVTVDTTGQARRRVTPRRNPAVTGIYEGSLAGLADGQYEILMVEPQLPGTPPSVRFSVAAPPGEFARPEMDESALRAASQTTHGKFYTAAEIDRLLADLPIGRRVPVENLPPISIWNRWWLLAAFLFCITSEWILRKRKGML